MSNLPPGVTQTEIDRYYGFDGPEPDDDEDEIEEEPEGDDDE